MILVIDYIMNQNELIRINHRRSKDITTKKLIFLNFKNTNQFSKFDDIVNIQSQTLNKSEAMTIMRFFDMFSHVAVVKIYRIFEFCASL